jgi:antitoxin VapB
MNKSDQNRLSDVHRAFDMSGAFAADGTDRLLPYSSKTHRLKVFKSGNSLALRLPKALGLEAGMEMELTVDGMGGYALARVEPPRRKIDISGFAGKLPGFKPAPREDFEERPSAIAARKAALKE